MADGSTRCWGRNAGGELGDGSTVDRGKPVLVDGVQGAIGIAMGTTFSCALMADKTVRCWGTGRILGDGKQREKVPPTQVPGIAGGEEMRASGLLACVRFSSGGVRCWGLEGDARRHATSDDVPDLGRAAEIAAASVHACARTISGSVRCWGDLGWAAGSEQAMARPSIPDARQLVTGDDFTCAVTTAETVKCWGRNDEGQLGVAPNDDVQTSPIEIPGIAGAVRLAAGEGQACAMLKDGTVRCWGANPEGELGLGTRSTTELPQVALKGLFSVREVCIGSVHACARTSDGAVYCWGSNQAGQIGDGTRERRLAPTRVSGLGER